MTVTVWTQCLDGELSSHVVDLSKFVPDSDFARARTRADVVKAFMFEGLFTNPGTDGSEWYPAHAIYSIDFAPGVE